MDAKLLETSLSFFEDYSNIVQRLTDRLLLVKPGEYNETNLSLGIECKRQIDSIITFLKMAKILSLKVDTETVDRLAEATENWVYSFKTMISRNSKLYKSE